MKYFNLVVLSLILSLIGFSCTENVDSGLSNNQQKAAVLNKFSLLREVSKIHSRGLDYVLAQTKERSNSDLQKSDEDQFILNAVIDYIGKEPLLANLNSNNNQRTSCIDHLERIMKSRAPVLTRANIFIDDDLRNDANVDMLVKAYEQQLDNLIATSVSDAQRVEMDKIFDVEAVLVDEMVTQVEMIITKPDFLNLSEDEQNLLLLGAAVYVDSYEYWNNHMNEWVLDSKVVTRGFWRDTWKFAKIDGKGALWGGIGGAIAGSIGGAIAGSFAGGVGAAPGALIGGVSCAVGGAVGNAIVESARACFMVKQQSVFPGMVTDSLRVPRDPI